MIPVRHCEVLNYGSGRKWNKIYLEGSICETSDRADVGGKEKSKTKIDYVFFFLKDQLNKI